MTKLPRDIGCQIDGCDGRTYAKALCQPHYHSSRYTPRLYPGRVSCKRTVAENIDACTRRNKTTGCLEWTGHHDEWGYGRYGADKRAHRIAYAEAFGPIPAGLMVCHRCDNPACVEPSHLFLGTNDDNILDKISKGRCSLAKLTQAQVIAIRSDPRPRTAVASSYGVSITTIRRICTGKSWRFAA